MKKVLVVAAVIALCFTLAGCGGSESAISREVNLKDAELSVPYYESEVNLSGVWAYETEKNYEYTLYIVTAVDKSKLSEKELKFFDKDVEFSVYVDGGKNEVDFGSASELKRTKENSVVYTLYVYPSPYVSGSADNRESYIGSKVVVAAGPSVSQRVESKDFRVENTQSSCVINEFTPKEEFNEFAKKLGYASVE